ncbi:MAG TPA: tRNA (guanosine(37)-N1)-methyltransferase TrmD [Vicinamibacterales bacterium]
MRIDIVTIFPEMVRPILREGVVARAHERGLLDVAIHDLRDFTTDRHRVVDDTPFGGGPGMVLKPEPFFRAVAHIRATAGEPSAVILPSPQGRRFTHADAVRLSGERHLVLLCGRYEGIDERVREALATEEISIGDYVLSGGELPAMVIVDAVARQVPGVVGDARSVSEDSFARPWLDYPHYTRPAEWEGRKVPEVLLSGHHAAIARWRLREALRRTLERRPDLLVRDALDAEARSVLDELLDERSRRERES